MSWRKGTLILCITLMGRYRRDVDNICALLWKNIKAVHEFEFDGLEELE